MTPTQDLDLALCFPVCGLRSVDPDFDVRAVAGVESLLQTVGDALNPLRDIGRGHASSEAHLDRKRPVSLDRCEHLKHRE